jgi:hypothetical protein
MYKNNTLPVLDQPDTIIDGILPFFPSRGYLFYSGNAILVKELPPIFSIFCPENGNASRGQIMSGFPPSV